VWLGDVDLPDGFDVVLPPMARLDPINEPARVADTLGATEARGATIVTCSFRRDTLGEYLDTLEALAALHGNLPV
jgi:hypothetical protein